MTEKKELTNLEVKEMLLGVAKRIIESEDELSEADRRLGDGDHGLGMKRGMEAAREQLEAAPEETTAAELFTIAGKAMMSSMGGASGVIFGTLFRAGGKQLKDRGGSFTAEAFAATLAAALESIMKRGGATPGDKTMVDALAPAAGKAAEVTSLPMDRALAEIATAAEAGRDASIHMIATMGRARTLGERSLGHPDAGACSVAIILRSMADYAAETVCAA